MASNRRVPTRAGTIRVDELAARVPATGWQTYSCGAGSKGHRDYQWAWFDVVADHPGPNPNGKDGKDDAPASGHHLLIRRDPTTGELAFFRCYSPRPVGLPTLVRVAGKRWRVEESFQAAKGLTGLDEHQVRRWDSWHRWTTLTMLAHAFLAVTTAAEHSLTPAAQGLIALTVNEVRRLFNALLTTTRSSSTQVLAWSTWRRRHQARARHHHFQRRGHHPDHDLRLYY